MSLEQALNEATAAIKQLIVVMTTANESGAALAATGTNEGTETGTDGVKRKRRTKAEMEADAAAAAAAQQAGNSAATLLVEGDPQGTRYWHIAAHNTVYRQRPGEADCTIAGAQIIAGSEYLALKAKYAAMFPTGAQGAQTAAPAPAPAQATPAASTASSQPPAASQGVTMVQVVEKAKALHARDGNAGLKVILDQFGVASVPGLAAKDLSQVMAAIEAKLNPPASDNLFG